MKIEKETKGFREIHIVIETEREARIFFHLLNWNPSGYPDYQKGSDHKTTEKEIDDLRHQLWEQYNPLVGEVEK